MAHDALRNSGLVRGLTDLLADLSDLVQKEIRLARAELAEKISARLQASVWLIAASVLGLITALLIVEGLVLAIASYGLALHWSCLLVAAIVAALGTLGCVPCTGEERQPGYERIAVFAKAAVPTHAARQLPSGRWTEDS
jgi:uncharacterized membrane protein YqjE